MYHGVQIFSAGTAFHAWHAMKMFFISSFAHEWNVKMLCNAYMLSHKTEVYAKVPEENVYEVNAD